MTRPATCATTSVTTIVTRDSTGYRERFRGKFLKVWRGDPDGGWRIRVDSYSPAPDR